MRLRILYFASLAAAAGRDAEVVESAAPDLKSLYAERAAAHGFTWPLAHLRVALDGEFASWDAPAHADAEVVFIPPVSGG